MSENTTKSSSKPDVSEVDMTCLVRKSYEAWLKYSGFCEDSCPFEADYQYWLAMKPHLVGQGTMALRVLDFHAGFLSANTEVNHEPKS